MPEHPADARDVRRWPSGPLQLIDTTLCPSCFTTLQGAVCGTCGLDLSVPAAAELLNAGRAVHDREVDRQKLITTMRASQAARVRQAAAASSVTDAAAHAAPAAVAPAAIPAASALSVAVPDPASTPVAPQTPVNAPITAAPAAPATTAAAATPLAPAPARSGRSGVQVLLLTLGVVLISITAIVFLFVAYLVASLEVRSIIIAVASVAVLGVAWLLRARRLPGTAEGVASVAIVLLLLDVWIVRANMLFGTETTGTSAYLGGALLVVAAVLAGVRAASGIRVAGFAAAAFSPVGVFLLAIEAAPDDQLSTPFWVGFLAVSLLGSLAVLLPAMIERTIVMTAGFIAGALALLPAYWALPEVPWSRLWWYLAVAAAWLVALVAVRLRPGVSAVWGRVGAPAFGLSLALAPTLAILGELPSEVGLWLGPAAAGLVAAVFAAGTRLTGAIARDSFAACVTALAVAACSVLPGVFLALGAVWTRLAGSLPPWNLEVAEPLPPATPGHDLTTVLVPVVVGVGALVISVLLRRGRELAAIPTAAVFASGIAVACVVPGPAIAAALLLVLAGGALALAAFRRRLDVPALLATLAVGGVASAGFAWWVGYSSAAIWPWVTALVIVLVITGRVLAPRVWPVTAAPVVGAAHLATASTLFVFAVFSIPFWLAAGDLQAAEPWMWLAIVSSVLLGFAALVRFGSTIDRVCMVTPLFAASVISVWALAFETDASWRWVPAAALVIAGVLWVRLGAPEALRVAFAAVTPLALGFVSAVVVDETFGAEFIGVGVAGSAVLAAGLAHVVPPRTGRTRLVWAVATGAVGAFALMAGATASFGVGELWVVLLLLTPVPILLAALEGDPIGGEAPSRHLSWLSLALGVATVWAWLSGDPARDPIGVEAYTLPLAAALALAGGLITWRRTSGSAPSQGRTALFATAAAIAVLPSIGTAGEAELRALLLVSIGLVVAIAAMFLPELARGVPVRLLGVLTGWVAFTGAGLVRGATVATDGADSVLIAEFWPLIALAAGVTIAVMWARTASRPLWLAEVLLAASVVLAAVPTVLEIVGGDSALVRSAVLFPVLALVCIASAATSIRPLAGSVPVWTMLGSLTLGGTIVLLSGELNPFDLVTASLGVALIGAGWFRMRRSPEVGSWPALGPGLAVLLVPPLFADFTDPQLWRIVTLGVVAVVVLVIGAVRRLQAPLLLGGAVLLVHALVQLWPWITDLYEAVWWWLWLGIAGVLLVVLAATYERQLRLARGTIRSIAALR
ncbi:SCO7613 C-terminal domain-containing membrane protein [Agromyces sp. CCNWLW203]|uniref:SCO7613 C-terminal domain-containing membrane protein n=1 Tax=Agromyces sp. CCNWLW203 TaxID=3112842 RepID=UPI002F966F2D